MPLTNTIQVILSPGESLHAATSAFRQFGDVSSLELLPGDLLMASVVFFDVRAASKALQSLGLAVAQPAPQTGNRIAMLSGNTQMKTDAIDGVSNVFYDPCCGGGTFAVEFYDVRDAMRAQEVEMELESGPAEGVERSLKSGGTPPSSPSLGPADCPPVPVYVIPSTAALPRSAAAAAADGAGAVQALATAQNTGVQELQPAHFTVRITGIPHPLLSNPCMEAVLQQAGLLDSTIHFKTELGEGEKHSGDALVTFLSYAMAQQCISHFLGRQWNTTGGEVSAWLEPTDCAAPGQWSSPAGPGDPAEARLRCDSGNTEASTATGGASETEEEGEGGVAR